MYYWRMDQAMIQTRARDIRCRLVTDTRHLSIANVTIAATDSHNALNKNELIGTTFLRQSQDVKQLTFHNPILSRPQDNKNKIEVNVLWTYFPKK